MMLILIVEHHGKQNLIIFILCVQEIVVLRKSPTLTSICISTPSCKLGCRVRDKKKQGRWILLEEKREKFIAAVRKWEMLVATKVKMQTWKNTWKISSLIEHVTRKFHVVVMQNNNREMYKKVCCISKVVFLLIMTYGFFCRSHCWSPFSVMWFYFLFEYNYINESFAFS